MLGVPTNNLEIKEILRNQLALLAEESKKCKNEPEIVVALSNAMNNIACTLFEH